MGETTNLIEVRCPLNTVSKNGFKYTCNQMCVKVLPGSKGEAYCSRCKRAFQFEIEDGKSGFRLPAPSEVADNPPTKDT